MRKSLRAIIGMISVTVITGIPISNAYATEYQTQQEANKTTEPGRTSSMTQEYIDNAINNTMLNTIMTDASVIAGRTDGYNTETASSWLENSLSSINIEGIDTSKYSIVDTSENLNIINAKYASAKAEIENNNYYTAFIAKTNSKENKSITAKTIFADTYSDVYNSLGKDTGDKSISDVVNSYGNTETVNINSDEKKTVLKLVADKDNKTVSDYISSYNKKEKDNKNAFSAKSDDIDVMLNTFKADLNNNYSEYIGSDAYNAIYSAIASTNVTDKIATRQVLPTTISQASLMAEINKLDEQVPISAETVKSKAEINRAATEAGYNNNKGSIDAKALQTYNAAVASAKIESGYLDAYKSYLDASGIASLEQTNTTTTLTFNNEEDFATFAALAGLDLDDNDYYYYSSTDDEISDNKTYVHLDGDSVVLNTQESKMFSDAIKESGAQVSTISETDYLTWENNNDSGLSTQDMAIIDYTINGLKKTGAIDENNEESVKNSLIEKLKAE